MRAIYLILILFWSVALQGQSDRIFGLYFIGTTLQLASLDESNGDVQLLGPTSISPDAFAGGVADFDPVNKEYFYARFSGSNYYVYVVDALTGLKKSQVLIDNPDGAVAPITNFAYNWMDETLYGVSHESGGGTNATYLKFVSVDLDSGTVTQISPGNISSDHYLSGNSDINPIQRKYYYATPDRIYTVDLDSGTVQSALLDFPPANHPQSFVNLTYNYLDQKIYGLQFLSIPDPNPFDTIFYTSELRLATVNPTSGQVNIISQQPTSSDGFSMGDCDINPQANVFYYIRLNRLYTVDLTTGNVLSDTPIQNPNSAIAPITNMTHDDLSESLPNIDMPMEDLFIQNPGDVLEVDAWLGSNATYVWNDGVKGSKRDITKPGLYSVEIKRDGFRIVGSFSVNSLTDVESVDTETVSLEVFPNPADDYLQYTLNGLERFEGTIELMSIDGKLINSFRTKDISGKLNLTGLASGNYLLKATDNTIQLFKKIIVSK